jgi:hypothetical protein
MGVLGAVLKQVMAFGPAAGQLIPQAILPQQAESFGVAAVVALARFQLALVASLEQAVAVVVTPGEPERVAPHVMLALAARAAQQVRELMEPCRVAAAEVAEAETAALGPVAKFAFGQLGDRHEQS